MTRDELIAAHGKRKVRLIVQDSDPASTALLDIASAGRKDWTMPDWVALLNELYACDMVLNDWLLLQ